MVRVAEDLGFDNAWFTEHHFSKHGIDSAVLTMMAGLARETSRIRLGTAVSVLPFWNPVRLAEEVAVVDILSDGRFDFGVGITDFSFQVAFGPPIERIVETLETLAKHVLPEARRFTPAGAGVAQRS